MANSRDNGITDENSILYRSRWAINKIRNRDWLYVPRRLSYSIKKRFIDLVYSSRQTNYSNPLRQNIPKAADELITYFRTREKPFFYFRLDQINEIINKIPASEREESIKEATEILHNRFTFRGIGPVIMDPIDWAYSPGGNALGWRWDLNRHFMFTTLGFAYWYTKDIRFAQKFFNFSNSWIKSNADKIGKIDGDTPFEVAARINAWIWAYFLFLPLEWEPGAHQKFLYTLGKLTDYLYHVIEYHNPGNHIILEAKALALCAGLFPEFEKSGRWNKRAWEIINAELAKQICEDGVHAERSTMYHRIVAGELAELLIFIRRNEFQSQKLAEAILRMAQFIAWVAGGVLEMPVFGDGYIKDAYFRFWAPEIIKAEYPQSDLPPFEFFGSIEQTRWAIGIKANEKEDIARKPLILSALGKAFPKGGYFISRWSSGSLSSGLVWDCGPVGYEANPYHSHLDTLSIVLAVNGIPFLIDPGIDERDIDKNRQLRQTAAHNTVVIDGKNQSVLAPLGRRSEVWSPARASLHTWATSQDFDIMIGSHDGYCRLSSPVSHKRTIISMREMYWLILDELGGKGLHIAEQRFHIAPDTIVEEDPSGRNIKLIRQNVALYYYPIRMTDSNDNNNSEEIVIKSGIAGLLPYKIEDIKVITACHKARLPFDMGVVLAPQESDIIGARLLSEKTESNKSFVIELRGTQFCDNIFFRRSEEKGKRTFYGFQSDAEVMILREREGQISDIFTVGATFLSYGAKELWKKPKEASIPPTPIEYKNICHFPRSLWLGNNY